MTRRATAPFAGQQQHRYLSSTSSSSHHYPRLPLQILPSVQTALDEQRPVVALESTIVGLGLPWPENVQLCRSVATILRRRGVEPATLALRDGVVRIGLTTDELEDLGQAPRSRVTKCSTRDLPWLVAQGRSSSDGNHPQQQQDKPHWGVTTVASTMVLAHQAGISTFVTGGIGGVHRGGHDSLDISADLLELARTPVVVVSAGIKSILDIPKTLEVLETQGVPTAAYQTRDFPAFFSPTSGVTAPARVESADQVAAAFQAARQLQLPHGMLVAVPNPDAAEGPVVETAIHDALAAAHEQGIHGNAVTPFVLQRVADTTGGASLRSNLKLVERNAEVGAEIAVAIAQQRQQQQRESRKVYMSTTTTNDNDNDEIHQLKSRVVVMGGIVQDTVAKPQSKLLLGTSNPASSLESDGGVGRNIAEALGRLGSQPTLFSAVGNDVKGQAILQRLQSSECQVRFSPGSVPVIEHQNTASYIAVLDHEGDLHTACADMDILQHISIPSEEHLRDAEFLILDANPPLESLHQAAQRAHDLGVAVLLEPTSVPKAKDIALRPDILCAMTDGWDTSEEEVTAIDQDDELIRELCRKLLFKMNPAGAHLLVTRGKHGLFYASKTTNSDEEDPFHYQQYDVQEPVSVVLNATGAGDTLTGAFVHALLVGNSMEAAIQKGMQCAALSLKSRDRAVSPKLSLAG